jgi:hypothetical protein
MRNDVAGDILTARNPCAFTCCLAVVQHSHFVSTKKHRYEIAGKERYEMGSLDAVVILTLVGLQWF